MASSDFFPEISWDRAPVFATGDHRFIDGNFLQRMCTSYRHQVQRFEGRKGTIWGDIAERNRGIHDALLDDDITAISKLAADPISTNLFYGFESSVGDSIQAFRANPTLLNEHISSICDRIVCLGEAAGALKLWYPEAHGLRKEPIDLDTLLDLVDQKIGIRIEFPNPFPNEFGVATSRGIASYRAVQAIYQAIRVHALSRLYGSKVVEIGAGLGRTVASSRSAPASGARPTTPANSGSRTTRRSICRSVSLPRRVS